MQNVLIVYASALELFLLLCFYGSFFSGQFNQMFKKKLNIVKVLHVDLTSFTTQSYLA